MQKVDPCVNLCWQLTNVLHTLLGKYPSEWKLADIFPLHKKIDPSQTVIVQFHFSLVSQNYFKGLCDYLIEIGFLYRFQSLIRPRDSKVNQWLCIVSQIYLAFEQGKHVGVVQVDI